MQEFKILSRSVAGSNVIITGAAGGMGLATARVFAAEGANVAVTDHKVEAAEAAASEIRSRGGNAKAWKLDVANSDEIRRVVDETVAHFGGIDVVINNAGVSGKLAIDEPAYEDQWDRHILVLLTSHQRMVRAALPHLRKSRFPRIVNIASTEALGATARQSTYS